MYTGVFNDHEMSSAVNGSALEIIAEYDLGHVDHVEVYLGGSAIKFGNEYGFVTIKIYTKDPKRENGGFVATSYGSRGSHSLEAFHTGVSENALEYLLYAKKKYDDKGEISNQGYSVPRYSDNINIYANIKKEDDYILELSSYMTDHDALAGVGIQKTPELSEVYSDYKYISFSKYIDGLKIQASYSQEQNGVHSKDPNGIKLNDGSIVNELDVEFENSLAKLSVENVHKLDDLNILYGISYQQKKADSKNEAFFGVDTLDIYSAYLEAEYELNDENLIFATGKFSHYKHQGYSRSDNLYEARLGFVSLLAESLTLKAFVSHNYIYPSISELIQFNKIVNGDPELKPMEVDNYSGELIYIHENHNLSFMYMQMHIRDPIRVNAQQMHYNWDVHAVFHDYGFDYTYTFNQDHKLMLEYYFTEHNRPSTASPGAGGYVKLFNTVGMFDIYNELIYREGYYSKGSLMHVKDGYDWTASISYEVNKELSLALKGENLLDKSIASPIKGLYPVEVADRSVMLYATWSY